MEITQAKKAVIAAGERLVESGLIARTWGNVSCRVSDNSFVITPSGKPYIGLTPDDIVEVKIDDLYWEGDVKPSSEKGIHAEVYKIHPNANFVIHTHQKNASAISALKSGLDTVSNKLIGSKVFLGGYGLPGTGKLKKGVANALRLSSSKAVIMAHHGAVCFGKDSDEAFEVALALEKECESYILCGASEKLGTTCNDFEDFCKKIAKNLTKNKKTIAISKSLVYNSYCDRDRGEIILENRETGAKAKMNLTTGETDTPVDESAKAHRDIYLVNPGFKDIIHNCDTETVAVSALGKTMRPLLDDFSQLCGTRVKTAKSVDQCGKKVKGKNAVLLEDRGALCCGKNSGDAQAVDMIMSKSCLTLLTSKVFPAARPINPVEALLMRVIYLKKYSKQAED